MPGVMMFWVVAFWVVALSPVTSFAITATELVAQGAAAGGRHGWSVDMDGHRAVVGALGEENHAGAVRVYELDFAGDRCGQGIWCEVARLTIADGDPYDSFGVAVSIDGDRIAIGAMGDDDAGTTAGAVYVFERSAAGDACMPDEWCLAAKLTASDATAYDGFGSAVAVDGDRLVAGARFKDSGTGAAYVFELDAASPGAWTETRLPADTATGAGQLGSAVALDGDTVIVGAYADSSGGFTAGAAFLYELDLAGERCGAGSWCETRLTASDSTPFQYFGVSVAVDGDRAVVGAMGDGVLGDRAGALYVYERNIDGSLCPDPGWCETRLTASDGTTGAYFGQSVTVDGARIIASAVGMDQHAGAAYLYRRNVTGTLCGSDTWCETRLPVAGGQPYDYFGYSAAIDGDRAIVGAFGKDAVESGSGAAYVYELAPEVRLVDPGGKAHDRFGLSVATDGARVIVGAPAADSSGIDSGAVQIYERGLDAPGCGPLSWCRSAVLTASDGGAGDYFGVSVAIHGDTGIVGAIGDTEAGASPGKVYFFERAPEDPTCGPDGWCKGPAVVPAGARAGDNFGIAVAIDSDRAIVGANGYSAPDPIGEGTVTASGAAYIYERNAGGAGCTGQWCKAAMLVADDREPFDLFGTSVALAGDVAVVGSWWDDGLGRDSGSAHVFERGAAGCASNEWCQTAKLVASDGFAGLRFGISVSIDDGFILVGAVGRQPFVTAAGAAYLFERDSTGTECGDPWCETRKFVPSSGTAQSGFGISVGIDRHRIVTGAWSDGKGGVASGAVYVYEQNLSGTRCADEDWCETATLVARNGAAADGFGGSIAMAGDVVIVGVDGDDGRGRDAGAAYLYSLASLAADDVRLVQTEGLRHWSDGSSAASCHDYRYPPAGYAYAGAVGDGVYRIDPGDDDQPYAAWCDMTSDGGGWTLVANQAGSGNWLPCDPSLDPKQSCGTYPENGAWEHDAHYYRPFADLAHDELLFRSGSGETWCVLAYDAVIGPNDDLYALNVPVIAAGGAGIPADGRTNVLFRNGPKTDPWIGCEGVHTSNVKRMLWGESDYAGHTQFKNDKDTLGIGLFVRPSR